MHRTSRTGLVLCAIALLLAACSGSGGSHGTSTSPVPQGIGGPGKHHNGQHSKHNGKHHHKGGKPTSSSSSANHPAHSGTPTQGHSSHPTQHTSSTPSGGGGGGGGGSHTSSPPAHHPPAGPQVTVTPHLSLTDGQTVTVEGSGFAPNTLLAVAECQDRGTQTSLPDCNINSVITYAPGKKVRSDASGHVGPVQIVVAKTFKSVNCATVKCLVAVSEPTLNPNPSDEGDQYIHFA